MKEIHIGDIDECFNGNPLENFKEALELSKQDDFYVQTNNAQVIEALEVLCGEKNIKICLRLYGKITEIKFITAYNYIGDFYDIIDCIRLSHIFGDKINDMIDDFVEEYEDKYLHLVNDKKMNG